MILSRISVKCRAARRKLYLGSGATRLNCLLLLLLLSGISSCGPKKPVIPDDVEAIARSCYETLATLERTPKLEPSEAMEDGTYLILWSMVELPEEKGSCIVDGSGEVILLTNNADLQEEPPAE